MGTSATWLSLRGRAEAALVRARGGKAWSACVLKSRLETDRGRDSSGILPLGRTLFVGIELDHGGGGRGLNIRDWIHEPFDSWWTVYVARHRRRILRERMREHRVRRFRRNSAAPPVHRNNIRRSVENDTFDLQMIVRYLELDSAL